MKYLKVRYVLLGLGSTSILYLFFIPVKLAKVREVVPIPQAIFVLGGDQDREIAAARLAHQHPELDVWISTGSSKEKVSQIFTEAGIPLSRLHLDYRAVDTVTNFTTMVEVFQKQNVNHVYLLTSDFHMRRASAIAFFVFGSRGITCTLIKIHCTSTSILSRYLAKSTLHILRDVGRSLVWLAMGRAGVATAIDTGNSFINS